MPSDAVGQLDQRARRHGRQPKTAARHHGHRALVDEGLERCQRSALCLVQLDRGDLERLRGPFGLRVERCSIQHMHAAIGVRERDESIGSIARYFNGGRQRKSMIFIRDGS